MGYLVWFKKMLFFIAGYNEATFTGDKEQLAKSTGIIAILAGILVIILPFALYFFGMIAGVVFCALCLIGLIVVFLVKNKKS